MPQFGNPGPRGINSRFGFFRFGFLEGELVAFFVIAKRRIWAGFVEDSVCERWRLGGGFGVGWLDGAWRVRKLGGGEGERVGRLWIAF